MIDIADPDDVTSAGDWAGPGAAVDGAATGAAINRAPATHDEPSNSAAASQQHIGTTPETVHSAAATAAVRKRKKGLNSDALAAQEAKKLLGVSSKREHRLRVRQS